MLCVSASCRALTALFHDNCLVQAEPGQGDDQIRPLLFPGQLLAGAQGADARRFLIAAQAQRDVLLREDVLDRSRPPNSTGWASATWW